MSLLKWFGKRNPASTNPKRKRLTKDHGPTFSRPFLEILEDRIAPAVALHYGDTGTQLSLTELVGGQTPAITISDTGTTLTIDLGGHTFDASSTSAIPGVLTYNGSNTVATVDIGVTNRISTLVTNLPGDELDLGPISNTSAGVSNINASANAISVLGAIDTTNVATGNGNIALVADTFVKMAAAGDDLLTTDGSITVKANVGAAPTAGQFTGILATGAHIQTTGVGNILLQGHGGSFATAGNMLGVSLQTAALVQTVTGTITVDGSGGHGNSGSNGGVLINAANVTSATGTIHITGTGGTGTGGGNFGVVVQAGSVVQSTGTAAINITGTGTGGDTIGGDFGVEITVLGSSVQATTSGSISITGTGGTGSGSGNFGIMVDSGGTASTNSGNVSLNGTGGNGANGVAITTTGLAVSTGGGSIDVNGSGGGAIVIGGGTKMTATGAGTLTLDSAQDVAIGDGVTAGTQVSTQDGALTISANQGQAGAAGAFVGIAIDFALVQAGAGPLLAQGKGGSDTAIGGHDGILIQNGSTVATTTGNLTLDGTGGAGSNGNIGVHLGRTGGPSTVTSASGVITITGHGAIASGSINGGVLVDDGSTISSTGSTSPLAAVIFITGTGGHGTSSNFGVDITGPNTTVSSFFGGITITGTGGSGSLDSNFGVSVDDGALVTLQTTTAPTGAIAITGTGGSGTDANWGVDIGVLGTSTAVRSGTGNIAITGTGGSGTGVNNFGVSIDNQAQVSTTAGALALISITGTGGTGTVGVSDQGVVIAGPTTAVSAAGGGSVQVNGSALVGNGAAIQIIAAATVNATGQGTVTLDAKQNVVITGSTVQTVDGNLTIKANQGQTAAAGNFGGLLVEAGSTVQTTGAGDIIMAGQGGNDALGGGHFGVSINAATVTSAGTGIAITGTAGKGTDHNFGLQISNTQLTLANGAIVLAGTGGASAGGAANFDFGVQLDSTTKVLSTGTAGAAATITINGIGGKGTGDNFGVLITDAGTQVRSIDGAIAITGKEGTGTDNNNYGVKVANAAVVQSTGTATIDITGTKGSGGTDNNFGVAITDNAQVQSTASGDITLTGTGASATATLNFGVGVLSGAAVLSTGTGNIKLSGTGGGGNTATNQNFGVHISAGSLIAIGGGAIAVDGTAGKGIGLDNEAIALGFGVTPAALSATAAPITLRGDSMLLGSSATISATGANALVTLAPLTAGTKINLGGPNAAGTLGLTQDELHTITADIALQIGAGTTGEIDITLPITDAGTGWSTLALVNSSAINQPAPGSLTVTNLLVQATGPVHLTATDNATSTLAAHISAGTEFALTDSVALLVGTVLGTAGIASNGGNVLLTTPGLITIGTGAGESIHAGGGSVQLNGAGVTQAANSIIDAGGVLLAGSGTFTLTNNNTVQTLAGNATGIVSFTNVLALTIGSVLGTNGLTSHDNLVTLDITTGGLNFTAPVNAGTAEVDLEVTGAITTTGQVFDVVAAMLVVPSTNTTDMGAAINPLNTQVASFAANVNGGIFLTNTGALDISTISATSGVSAGGNIVISTSKSLAVNDLVITAGTVTLTGSHSITLNAVIVGTAATVAGSAAAETITVNIVGPTPLTVAGKGGGDSYVLNLGLFFGPITVDGSGLGTNGVIINGQPATDTWTVTDAAVTNDVGEIVNYSAIENLSINGGAAGANVFKVESTAASVLTQINTGAGSGNRIYVSSSVGNFGVLTGLHGVLSVDAQGAATVLNVSEAGEAAADNVTVTGKSISSSVLHWTVNYTSSGVFSSYSGVNFATGTAHTPGLFNVVSVQGTVKGATTVIVSAGALGISSINVVSPSPNNNQGNLVDLLGPLSVLDQFGKVFLTVSDVGSSQPDTLFVRNNSIFSIVPPGGVGGHNFTINYVAPAPGPSTGFIGINLATGVGNDAVHVESTLAGASTCILNFGGNDRITVGSGPTNNQSVLSTIAGLLGIINVGGTDLLTISDAGDPVAQTVNVTAGGISGGPTAGGPGSYHIVYQNQTGGMFTGISFAAGSGADRITVNSMLPLTLFNVYNFGGADTVTVNCNPQSAYNVTFSVVAGQGALNVIDVTGTAEIQNIETAPASGVVQVLYPDTPGGLQSLISYMNVASVFTDPAAM